MRIDTLGRLAATLLTTAGILITASIGEAATIPIKPRTVRFPLLQANQALQALKAGSFQGAAVLTI